MGKTMDVDTKGFGGTSDAVISTQKLTMKGKMKPEKNNAEKMWTQYGDQSYLKALMYSMDERGPKQNK